MGNKLTTDEILAQIRGGSSGGSSPAPVKSAPSPQSSTPTGDAAKKSVTSPAPAPRGPAPAGTTDILSAIRGGAAAAPGAKPASGAAPSSTADILAAARGGGAAKAKPAAGAPSGTSDILAAVRGGAAAPAAKAKPAAAKEKEKDKPSQAALAEASGLSVSELIKAARQGKSPEAAKDEIEDRAPRLPTRPLKPAAVPVAKKPVAQEGRRGFLGEMVALVCSPVVIAWTAMCSTLGIASLATARFMMPNVLVEPPTRFKIGPPSDYAPGTVSTKWTAQFGVWIVNAEIDGAPMIYALSTVCTHLGCTPNWLDGEQKFKCPCHGSGFYKTGVNFEGPAPRPLERMGIQLAADGMLEVDKSVKFQQELGQWENPASFVPVV